MINWIRRDALVAVFDILGFRNLASQADAEFPRALRTSKIEDLLASLDGSLSIEHGRLHRLVISHTIVLFAPSYEPKEFPRFL